VGSNSPDSGAVNREPSLEASRAAGH